MFMFNVFIVQFVDANDLLNVALRRKAFGKPKWVVVVEQTETSNAHEMNDLSVVVAEEVANDESMMDAEQQGILFVYCLT